MGVPDYLCDMFLRRKPNKSGSVSVQVVEKRDGKYVVLQSFGTGRNERAIQLLEQNARQWISERRGPQLPFSFEQDDIVESFVGGLTNGQLQVIGPELVYGSLYDHIGYVKLKNDLFRHLVVCRLFQPGSKLKTVDYLERYLHVRITSDKIYRMLDRLVDNENGFKGEVEQISYDYTRKVVGEKITVVFYDMTTLYFEASDEDDLRKCGFSKDGKHGCPQVFLGLLVTVGGNPIGYEIFEGNIFEGHTLIPVIEKLACRFGFDHPIIVADAGLLSKKNIETLESKGYKYILGARPKNEAQKIKDKILGLKLGYGQVRVIRRDKTSRLIVSMSQKRAAKDVRNRRLGLNRLEKRLGAGRLTKSSINNKGYNRYLEMEGEVSIRINYDKFNADAAWDGIKAYVTNTSLSKQKIIESYSNLWFIERAFRMNKTDLRIRPVYHRLRNRIEGHICICFTAYTIMLELERRLKVEDSDISLERAREIAKTMYRLSFHLPESKAERHVVLGMTLEQQQLVEIAQK